MSIFKIGDRVRLKTPLPKKENRVWGSCGTYVFFCEGMEFDDEVIEDISGGEFPIINGFHYADQWLEKIDILVQEEPQQTLSERDDTDLILEAILDTSKIITDNSEQIKNCVSRLKKFSKDIDYHLNADLITIRDLDWTIKKLDSLNQQISQDLLDLENLVSK